MIKKWFEHIHLSARIKLLVILLPGWDSLHRTNALGECNPSWVTKFNSRLLIVVTFRSIAATLTVEHARRATRQYAKSVPDLAVIDVPSCSSP